MRAAVELLVALFLLFLSGCAAPSPSVSRAQEYKPLFAGSTAGASGPGTIRSDFDNAAKAQTLADAASGWEQFLTKHKPANGEYEDSFQKMLIDSATYELIRVYYLAGQRDKGDELLKTLDPLQLR
jgi:hypothetical protein